MQKYGTSGATSWVRTAIWGTTRCWMVAGGSVVEYIAGESIGRTTVMMYNSGIISIEVRKWFKVNVAVSASRQSFHGMSELGHAASAWLSRRSGPEEGWRCEAVMAGFVAITTPFSWFVIGGRTEGSGIFSEKSSTAASNAVVGSHILCQLSKFWRQLSSRLPVIQNTTSH